MEKQEVVDQIRTRYTLVAGMLDERARRTVAASEALAVGRGGITLVARATGLARGTIGLGIKEVRGLFDVAPPGRLRRAGGGRKKLMAKDPTILVDLERLVEPTMRGDPESPLRWTCLSVRKLAAALGEGPGGRGSLSQPSMGSRGVERFELQPASQSQDAGGWQPA